jgi:hypothetical protein
MIAWDYSQCTSPDREPSSQEIISLTIDSINYLHSIGEPSAVRELVAAVLQAYQLQDNWKLQLWRSMPLDLQKWAIASK